MRRKLREPLSERRKRLPACVLAAALATGAGAHAEGAPRPQCAHGEGAAVSELACELARALPPLAGKTAVAVGPVQNPRTGGGGPRLGRELAAALGTGAAVTPATTLAQARASASDADHIVFVTVEAQGGRVRATADVRSPKIGFWDRVRGVKDESRGRSSAIRPVDGEWPATLPASPFGKPVVVRVRMDVPDAVAVACGRVREEDPVSVLLVGRHRIVLGRIDGARVRSLSSAEWSDLAPVAPSPLREPIAVARIPEDGTLHVATTDRDRALVLGADLRVSSRIAGALEAPFVGCLGRVGTAVGAAAPCSPGAPAGLIGSDVVLDALASGTAVTPSGAARRMVALRSPGGAVTLRDDAGRSGAIPSAGAALAVLDVDRDGTPEIVASENTDDPKADALVVRSFGADGSVTERERLPVPDGIRAVAACPPDGDGRTPILLSTKSELWVIR